MLKRKKKKKKKKNSLYLFLHELLTDQRWEVVLVLAWDPMTFL